MQPAIRGTWHNQHGSTLELVIEDGGLVHGTFRSAIGLPSKQEPYRVTGFVSGDGKESIETLWHMTAMAPDTWRSIWSGADVFHRELAASRPGPGAMPSHPTVHSHGPPRP